MAKEWSIKNLYFYLVCLVTLFLFVGGAISAINSGMQLALPDKPNVPIIYVYYPEYREGAEQPHFDPPPLEELERRRAEQEKSDIYYQGYTKRSLLNSIALMIIAVPFYLYHWKKVKPEW
ncbi:MAG: hypothetical protein SCJ97_11050 [Bacillota bacterium]|nr:hypothetical protein [Bacillota bacterium]